MKKKKIIFLSYRRDDSPGYVSKLEKDLEHYFGEDHVFRDVEDIQGGAQWKHVLADTLENSGALLVIIGPRWEAIWNEREDKENDYIIYELNKARELRIPIIPVTLNGIKLSDSIDLGPINWLMDNQQYDITDTQGRWPTDVFGLVNLLERQEGIERVKTKKEQKTEKDERKINKKIILIPLAIVLLVGLFYRPDQDPLTPPVYNEEVKQQAGAQVHVSPPPAPTETPEEKEAQTDQAVEDEHTNQKPPMDFPDIAGNWQSETGDIYKVGKVTNGRFMIMSPESSRGIGNFSTTMPRKFFVNMTGLGNGEYSVTTDNERIVGWFQESGTNQKEYETLWRVK